MPNAEKIIAAVERSNLVTADVVDQLRDKLDRTPVMGLRAAVKWLVEKRHITAAQGGRLLANIEDVGDGDDDFDLMPRERGDDIRQTRAGPAVGDDDFEIFPPDGADATSGAGNKAPGRSPSAASSSSARAASICCALISLPGLPCRIT